MKKEKKQTKESTFDKDKAYSIEEAVKIVKDNARKTFDESLEVHFRLGINPKKGDQMVRSAVTLPHGTGKTIKIAAFVTGEKEAEAKKAGADIIGGENLIAQIKKTQKTDFDVAVAEPAIMRHLAVIAKTLGTRGLMPSPKNETVTPNPAKAIEELKKGKLNYKNDNTSNVHVVIGKMSFKPEQLVENYNELLKSIQSAKPQGTKGTYIKNISISSSMGPGVKVMNN